MVMDITYDNLNSQLSLCRAYLPVFVNQLDTPRPPLIRTFSGTPSARTTKKPNQKTSETA
jgi:hypothetical protein